MPRRNAYRPQAAHHRLFGHICLDQVRTNGSPHRTSGIPWKHTEFYAALGPTSDKVMSCSGLSWALCTQFIGGSPDPQDLRL